MSGNDTVFTGSIPALYDRYLGPLLFAPFAQHTAGRVAELTPDRVLETAAGTGIVTEALATTLPGSTALVASDLNQAMIDHAATKPALRRVELRQADALALPFGEGSFDVVVCQFGAMFFPDRVAGYREARRVLAPGGRYVMSVWGDLEVNPMTRVVVEAVGARYPQNPPRFLARTPHGHSDAKVLRRDLAAAGFRSIAIETVTLPSRAPSAEDAAIGLCQGTPMRGEIEALDPSGLAATTDVAAAALRAAYGSGAIKAPMQAVMVVAA
ncbi:MAG: class I SAM-dependent methyltransferase [Proteobacteria bacterium]|nr:class I SAM-dependent methyltransferase [Pseudomonadota bacterium]